MIVVIVKNYAISGILLILHAFSQKICLNIKVFVFSTKKIQFATIWDQPRISSSICLEVIV